MCDEGETLLINNFGGRELMHAISFLFNYLFLPILSLLLFNKSKYKLLTSQKIVLTNNKMTKMRVTFVNSKIVTFFWRSYIYT